MKYQKLFVIVVSVCLIAFFNVSSFAKANDKHDDNIKTAKQVAEALKKNGYKVKRNDSKLEIGSGIILNFSDSENSEKNIHAHLDRQADMLVEDSAEGETDPEKLAECLAAVELLYEVKLALCQLHVNDAGESLCETEALYKRAIESLYCIELYVAPPPPSDDVVTVFLTSSTYQGNLGGLAGADAKCQERAEAAELPGTDWTAWLSDDTTNAIDRIPDGKYELVDGTPVADNKADLTSGTLKDEIDVIEFGIGPWAGVVWTGTFPDGTGSENNCNNWTDNLSGSVGDVGKPEKLNDEWTYVEGAPAPCNLQLNLYCFGGVE